MAAGLSAAVSLGPQYSEEVNEVQKVAKVVCSLKDSIARTLLTSRRSLLGHWKGYYLKALYLAWIGQGGQRIAPARLRRSEGVSRSFEKIHSEFDSSCRRESVRTSDRHAYGLESV